MCSLLAVTLSGVCVVSSRGGWDWMLHAVAGTLKLVLDILCVCGGRGVVRPLRFCARGLRPLAFLDQVALDNLVCGGATMFCIG